MQGFALDSTINPKGFRSMNPQMLKDGKTLIGGYIFLLCNYLSR